jgi:hypothetical protein
VERAGEDGGSLSARGCVGGGHGGEHRRNIRPSATAKQSVRLASCNQRLARLSEWGLWSERDPADERREPRSAD